MRGDLYAQCLDPNWLLYSDRIQRDLRVDHWSGIRFHQSSEEYAESSHECILVHQRHQFSYWGGLRP